MYSILVLSCLGLVAAIALGIAARVFYVKEDPRIEVVANLLPGANCGGCGLAGCAAAAEAIVAGKAQPDVCVVGGFEVAQQVAAVFGIIVEAKEPDISDPGCTYGYQDADLKFNYSGFEDCRSAILLFGGHKECTIGCLGLGACIRTCTFNALYMGENNLPIVKLKQCTGCGNCVEVCPKDIITLTSATRRMMSDHKVSECTAPCQRNCPAEIDIPTYIRHISDGNYADAVRIIKEKNPFPLICGWICPAPCEFECRRNLIDEPVNINALKKFVTDYEMKMGKRVQPTYLPKATGKNIAIIGGGVEGMTAAYFLRRLGHKPKVFEATSKLGGILRNVITEERLPREVIDWEIESILELGVEASTEKIMGRNFSLASLMDDTFDMILITVGGWDSRQIMRGKTRPDYVIADTHLLLDFLLASSRNEKLIIAEKVFIIGGDKVALKAADICLNNGAGEVTIVYPFSKKEAVLKGIQTEAPPKTKIIFSAMPVELCGQGDNLSEISIRNFDGTIEKMPLDNLIIGSGRFPEMVFEKTEDNKWKTVEILKVLPEEANIGLFAVSDIGRVSDLSGVVVAVGRARKIVRAVQLHILGEDVSPEIGVITDENELQNVYEIENAQDLQAIRIHKDSKITLRDEEARQEAARCLDCGLICYLKTLRMEDNPAIPA